MAVAEAQVHQGADRHVDQRFKYGDPDDLEYQKQIIDNFVNSVYVCGDIQLQGRHRDNLARCRPSGLWFGVGQ